MENTLSVTKETVNLDIFPGIESDQVLTTESGTSDVKVVNMFSRDRDLSFTDKPEAQTVQPENENEEKTTTSEFKVDTNTEKKGKEILDSLNLQENQGENEEEDDSEQGTDGKGRPKTSKNSLITYLKSKIEANEFSAFEDWDEKKESLDQYLLKQNEKTLHSMIDANLEMKEQELMTRTPVEFFESLPEELQYAARYVANGGTDLKNLFAALAQVEQVKSLDITSEEGQIATIRAFLQTNDFGDPAQIEEEIATYKETGRLEKKAKDFKPKLDALQKEQVEYQLQQQEVFNQQQQQAAQVYVKNVHDALIGGELNGLKLDKKQQSYLYNGLINANYPSASGKPTNLLGSLLDKIQYVEPDFGLLAEVTYLLSDPKGYREAIIQQGKNTATIEIAKKLKSEQQNNNTGNTYGQSQGEELTGTRKKIPFKPKNILSV